MWTHVGRGTQTSSPNFPAVCWCVEGSCPSSRTPDLSRRNSLDLLATFRQLAHCREPSDNKYECLPRAKDTFRRMPRLDVARRRYLQPCSQVGNSDAASGYKHRSNLFHFKVCMVNVTLSLLPVFITEPSYTCVWIREILGPVSVSPFLAAVQCFDTVDWVMITLHPTCNWGLCCVQAGFPHLLFA